MRGGKGWEGSSFISLVTIGASIVVVVDAIVLVVGVFGWDKFFVESILESCKWGMGGLEFVFHEKYTRMEELIKFVIALILMKLGTA